MQKVTKELAMLMEFVTQNIISSKENTNLALK